MAGELADRMVRTCLPLDGVSSQVPVVPVPTTRKRLRARGYNQARVLAVEVAGRIGAPVVDALDRRGDGRSQISLQPGERKANVESVFGLSKGAARVAGGPVLLVDDVLTTGATAAAGAEALGSGGVTSVTVLTFARALPDRFG